MPFYDFTCRRCGTFSAMRPMARRDEPATCPTCRLAAVREVTAPNLSLMPPGIRSAIARNEKSCHEPAVRQRHQCGSGCGCGTRSKNPRAKTRAVEVPKLGKFEAGRRGRRPWMLGH